MITKQLKEIALEVLRLGTIWLIVFAIALFVVSRELMVELPSVPHPSEKTPIAGSSSAFSAALGDAVSVAPKEVTADPTAFAAYVDQRVSTAAQIKRRGTAAASLPLAGRSILWVAGRPTTHAYEANVFRGMGATVIQVRSPDEALQRLAVRRYNLLVSEFGPIEGGMPDSAAGYRLVEHLVAQNRTEPLVFYASDARAVDPKRTRRAIATVDTAGDLIRVVTRTLSR
jgi:hypothetical protein